MQHIEEPYLQDNQGKQGSRQKGDNLGMPFWGRGGEKKKVFQLLRHYIWVCSSYLLANYLLNHLSNMFSKFRIAQEYFTAIKPTRPFLFLIHMTTASTIQKRSLSNFVINYHSYSESERHWSMVRGLNLQKELWNTGYTFEVPSGLRWALCQNRDRRVRLEQGPSLAQQQAPITPPIAPWPTGLIPCLSHVIVWKHV